MGNLVQQHVIVIDIFLVAVALLVERYRTKKDMQLLIKHIDVLKGRAADSEKAHQVQVTDLITNLREMTIKAESAMSVNADFQTSRDQAWDLYRRSSLGAGNAQAWLFRELQKTMGLLNQYRLKSGESPLKVPVELEEAVESFAEKHVKEVVATERPESNVG